MSEAEPRLERGVVGLVFSDRRAARVAGLSRTPAMPTATAIPIQNHPL